MNIISFIVIILNTRVNFLRIMNIISFIVIILNTRVNFLRIREKKKGPLKKSEGLKGKTSTMSTTKFF